MDDFATTSDRLAAYDRLRAEGDRAADERLASLPARMERFRKQSTLAKLAEMEVATQPALPPLNSAMSIEEIVYWTTLALGRGKDAALTAVREMEERKALDAG